MQALTLADLKKILRECAGEEQAPDPQRDISDLSFDELGYDSIALLETAGQLQRAYGAQLDDDAVTKAGTPRALLELANRSIAGR